MKGAFRVPRRVYSEPDGLGHRQLLHAEGAMIPWAQAVAEGLVSGDAVPAEEVPFTVPHNVYEELPGGRRRRLHREGSVISVAEAVRLELIAPPVAMASDPEKPEPEQAEEPKAEGADVEAMVTPQTGRRRGRPRTTKAPDPET